VLSSLIFKSKFRRIVGYHLPYLKKPEALDYAMVLLVKEEIHKSNNQNDI